MRRRRGWILRQKAKIGREIHALGHIEDISPTYSAKWGLLVKNSSFHWRQKLIFVNSCECESKEMTTQERQRRREFSTDSLERQRIPSDDFYYQGMLKAMDGRKGTLGQFFNSLVTLRKYVVFVFFLLICFLFVFFYLYFRHMIVC